jgi:hypothetical protein
MFKIEIQADDGRELKLSENNFIYYKGVDGKDVYWEWEHIAGKEKEFLPLFHQAKALIDDAEKRLPDIPMSGLR